MPVRNAGPWLAESLGSIEDQSEQDWELIAVDDGSSDDSVDLLRAHAARDRRISVLGASSHGGGIVNALNAALARVRSPLTARMDADDVCDRDRLALQCGALEADDTLFAVTCRVRPFPDSRLRDGMVRYFDWQHSLSAPEEFARDRFVESPLLHPSVAMRSQVLTETLEGWRDVAWPEDWDLFSRAFEAGLKIRRLPETLYSWRLHAGQATRCDDRYSEDSFRAARVHFLARALRARAIGAQPGARERDLWVMGAGPVGKKLGKALLAEGIDAAGFVDVDPKKIGGRVDHEGRGWPVIGNAEFRRLAPRPFALAAVGAAGGRQQIRELLEGWGWRESEDFYVAA